MAQTPPPEPSDQVIRRYHDLIQEQDDLNRKYELREQEELRALEQAKKEIEDGIKEERERLVRDMPANMPFPESFDTFLKKQRDDKIRTLQQEYEARKMERKKLHDAETLKQAEKWTSLFPTNNAAPSIDLTLPEPRPRKPVEVALPQSAPQSIPQPIAQPIPPQTQPQGHPPQIHPQMHPQAHPPVRPVDMRAVGQQREHPIHVVQSQHLHQYGGTPLPLLPRPPVVPSQPAPAAPQRAPPNGVYLHHTINQSRPLDAQRVTYPAQPPARLPEQQPPMAKQRTALPERARVPPEHRPELARASPQGSFSLPRILPLGEQHQARPDNEQFKRKAEGHPAPSLAAEKRPKVQESKPNDGARTELPDPPSAQKSISFDEVYQNGQPQYKHIIVEYPTNSRKYYILKCEEHGVHFNLNPLAGAAKHLHSAQHGNLSKERAQAVELLGYNIFDCDENKMQQNNQMVSDAFQNGYKPFNLNQLTKAERKSLNLPGDISPTATPPKANPAPNLAHRGSAREASQKLFVGIMHPVAGELYLGYWPTEKRNYAVIMLPFGDLRVAGVQGTLESTGLLDPSSVPKCYVYDRARNGWNWAEGYEDGGPHATKREFPVLYIDGRNSVGWLSAKDLSAFNFDDPLWREIPYFREAVQLYATNKGFRSVEDMREKLADKDRRFFGRNQHQFQHPTMVTARPPAAPLPPTTLPSQSSLNQRARVNVDFQKRGGTTIPLAEQADMVDASPVSDKDSYQASINKGLDSDNDVEMANTESRRTSVSNRGEAQAEHGGPEQVLKQPFAQPVPPAVIPPRPVDMARPYTESPRGGVYVMPPTNIAAVPVAPSSTHAHQPASSTPRPTNEFAQMIATQALHLERDQPPVTTPTQSRDFNPPTVARSEIGSSTSGSAASTNGNAYRPVEKILANGPNAYRTSPSRSPAMSATMLPEPRAENGSSKSSISRNSSPASLNNILQNPSAQPQAVMARPGPLSQNGPASLQPHLRPLPLDQSGTSTRTASPPMRSPSVLAGFTQTIQGPPSPPHSNGLGIQQPSRSPALEQRDRPRLAHSPAPSAPSNPPTRTPTPVIFKGTNSSLDDRWRAVRTESTTTQQSEASTPRLAISGLGPISTSSRPTADSPREPALMTPVTSVTDTRSNSPAQPRDPIAAASPAPSVKIESGESYALARVSADNNNNNNNNNNNSKEVIFDRSEAQGKLLPILVDPETKIASGSPRPGVELVVDPNNVKQAVVRPSGSPTASNVTLKMADGRELELVFETWELSVGRIHARRFCRWLKSVNAALEIDNKQASSTS